MGKTCFSLVYVLLVALHVGSSYSEPVDGEEVYDTSNPTKYEMPESCNGQSYCFEKGTNYPDVEIEKLLKDVLTMKVGNSEPRINFGSRFGNGEPECPYNSTENPIYYITDTNDKVRVVVQSPKFTQIYSVKWCQNEGPITKDTRHLLKHTVDKFDIKCVSTRMNFDFFVLNDNPVESIKMEVARAKGGIPVCCRCQYSKTENISMPNS